MSQVKPFFILCKDKSLDVVTILRYYDVAGTSRPAESRPEVKVNQNEIRARLYYIYYQLSTGAGIDPITFLAYAAAISFSENGHVYATL